ncbi:Putative serine protease HhoB precursor [Rosistilla carotiformis]|uniref:Serine protease HhoB n=1 Tax=Rosistilla carotiformis TaxID=2528017 RepID=A0A518JQZ7_9BACT|nr:trypsin-like peptidase domain-containing protein [Rosistilla carotiformis]QDV67962.1 Putative serine protease HhoB precursor [Rosistilla carotiformis]
MMNHLRCTLSVIFLAAVAANPSLCQAPPELDTLAALEAEANLPSIEKEFLMRIDDFRELETVLQPVARKAIAATVGVRLGDAYASGVIVSRDGFVLTAAHVSGAPGRSVRLTLSDGRTVKGTTLGQNTDVDGALIKIDGSGPWPFLPMADPSVVTRPGDWCLATGHPGGYDRNRPAPLRLGRVISVNGYRLRSDCPIEPGDSGGPLVDLRGYVIGVHSRIYDDATGNLHVPIVTYQRTWDRLKQSQVSALGPASSFLAQFDFDQDGQLTLAELPDGPRRDAYQRLGKTFDFDVEQPQEISELRARIGLDLSKRRNVQLDRPGRILFRSPGELETLSDYYFTRGMAALNVLRNVTEDASRWTVDVLVDGQQVSTGTIVGSDGWIVTKASEVEAGRRGAADEPPRIVCHLFDSKRYGAKLVQVDRQYDLAWLKIEATDLASVQWSGDTSPQVGHWVISTSRGRTPLSAGVVSVPAREIRSSPGFMGVGGSPTRTDAYVESIVQGSGAAGSDLRPGDVIVAVNDVKVPTFAALSTEVRRFVGGDVIALRVVREGEEQMIAVRLGHRIDPKSQDDAAMSGRLSERRDGFPFAFTHDSVLLPEECGGPLIDLDGKAVGINIARSQRTGSLALSAATVQRLFQAVQQRFPTPL